MTPALEALSGRFRQFATRECKDSSPLYACLSESIAADPELLSIALDCRESQPPPNLLFAAVQYLLFGEPDSPLAQFYPSIASSANQSVEVQSAFREFCLVKREEIKGLISTRMVQTNEVRRCSYMLPAYEHVSRESHGLPLSIIDVGASAGLHMLWPRYRYLFNKGGEVGDPDSPVRIESEVRGNLVPPIPRTLPEVTFRIGIDLNPVDLSDPDTIKWCMALIWPEHADRFQLLQAAIQVALQEQPNVIRGSIVERISDLVGMVPVESTLCLYHSHVLYQLSEGVRKDYREQVKQLSKERDIYWLSAQAERLELAVFSQSEVREYFLAHCHGHGKWFEWKLEV